MADRPSSEKFSSSPVSHLRKVLIFFRSWSHQMVYASIQLRFYTFATYQPSHRLSFLWYFDESDGRRLFLEKWCSTRARQTGIVDRYASRSHSHANELHQLIALQILDTASDESSDGIFRSEYCRYVNKQCNQLSHQLCCGDLVTPIRSWPWTMNYKSCEWFKPSQWTWSLKMKLLNPDI